MAGVAYYGIGDLKRLHETTHKVIILAFRRKYGSFLTIFFQLQSNYIPGLVGGTPEEIPDVYKARSPLFHAGKIKKPLLVSFFRHEVFFKTPIEDIFASSYMAEKIDKFLWNKRKPLQTRSMPMAGMSPYTSSMVKAMASGWRRIDDRHLRRS